MTRHLLIPLCLCLGVVLLGGCASISVAPDGLNSRQPATVTLVDGRTLQARRGFRLTAEELVLRQAGGETQSLPRREVHAIDTLSRTRGMRRWALVGAALGGLLSAQLIADRDAASEGWLVLMVPLTILSTTGLGAAGGLLVGEKVRYELNPLRP